MASDRQPVPEDLRSALVEALADPLRARVHAAIAERPGVTVAQIVRRVEETPRRVRRQVGLLLDAGLVVIDAEDPRRNARERHYRALTLPRIVEPPIEGISGEEHRRIAVSLVRQITTDLARAARGRSFGTLPGHAEIRVPGEVDERGWAELSETMIETMERIEAIMVGSAARLRDEGQGGREVVSTLLLFEAPAWDPGDVDRDGPRPSPWLAKACAEEAGGSREVGAGPD